ncbi:MAG TPA: Mur ligase family protein [Candidatus Dormibacteraeota bacterium]
MAALGDPQQGKRGALVAGTNGKGSTAAFLASILEARGLRTGTMPSPHLASYTERIQLGGQPVSEAEFAEAVERLRPALERVAETEGEPTEFEALTALAIAWLAGRADRLVIEVGMGGRLDSTNVLDLGVAIVTNVSLDHTQYLGATVEEIAREKAAIIKPGNLAVTAAERSALPEIERRAEMVGARLWRLGQELRIDWRWRGWEGSELDLEGPGFRHRGLKAPLLGSFQPANAALGVAAAEGMGDATPAAVAEGLAATRWPGRMEVLSRDPVVLLDGGHNPAGIDHLLADVPRLAAGARLVLVFGAMADKDLPAMLKRLRRLEPSAVVFTRAASAGDRAADPQRLAAMWDEGARVREPALDALAEARRLAGHDGVVLACGSLYLVGELR